ncbi:tyrosine-type recombinase/integrase [Lysobacter claricitrinus]|uniref:tyrosine-type recombinase/integrase n=1 Tax=Lysobacter claricitrinus TaxID=3367728 RepID=UPI0038B39CD9
MPRQATPLTQVRLRSAKNDDFPLWDGGGLHAIVTPSGERHWRFKYRRPDGRENRIAFGNLREVSLAQARQYRDQARALLRNGTDPAVARRATKDVARLETAGAFEAVAADWLAFKAKEWSAETLRKATYVTTTYLVPRLKRTTIATLNTRQAAEVLEEIADKAPSLAVKARQYLAGIVDFAIKRGLREDGRVLALKGTVPRHAKSHISAATEIRELKLLLIALRDYSSPVTRAALRLAMFTAMRPGVVASARWDEINLDLAEWHVPASRMKTRHAHIVPLPRQALADLELMRQFSGGSGYVFPAQARQKTPHLHRDSLSKALRDMGFKGKHATHGFRATLRTIGRERLGIDMDVLEAQLAHAKKGDVNKAYDRTQHLEERRRVMQAWADFLDSLTE